MITLVSRMVCSMRGAPDLGGRRQRLGRSSLRTYAIGCKLMSDSLKRFRQISLLEGLSFLVLLFIAMPLKYAFGYPLAVKIVGWAHGVLFILYFAQGLQTARQEGWSNKLMFLAVVASVLPFGPFILDRRLAQS